MILLLWSVRVHSGSRNRPTSTEPVSRKHSESLRRMRSRPRKHSWNRAWNYTTNENTWRSDGNSTYLRGWTRNEAAETIGTLAPKEILSDGEPRMPWMPSYFLNFTKPFLDLPRLDTFIQLVEAWIHRFSWLLLVGKMVKIYRLHWKMCSCRIMLCSCQAIVLLALALPRGLSCDVYIKVTQTPCLSECAWHLRVSLVPNMGVLDGLKWKIPLKWMIWGYPYFRKPQSENSMKNVNSSDICTFQLRVHIA